MEGVGGKETYSYSEYHVAIQSTKNGKDHSQQGSLHVDGIAD
jgi:hypothetical protein